MRRKYRAPLVALVAACLSLSVGLSPASATVTNYSHGPFYSVPCGSDVVEVTYWFAADSTNGKRISLSTWIDYASSNITWIESKALPVGSNGQLTTDGPTHYGGSGSSTGHDNNTAALWASGINVTNQTSISLLDGTTCELDNGSL